MSTSWLTVPPMLAGPENEVVVSIGVRTTAGPGRGVGGQTATASRSVGVVPAAVGPVVMGEGLNP
jgi:hypothetical protein